MSEGPSNYFLEDEPPVEEFPTFYVTNDDLGRVTYYAVGPNGVTYYFSPESGQIFLGEEIE